jgi:hypothetical protein
MAFCGYLRQSTATTLVIGPFLDDTDGKTPETLLTINQSEVLLWKEGGTTFAQKNESTAATHRSSGLYTTPINTTDTNTAGMLVVSVTKTGALPIKQEYQILPALVYDQRFSLNAGALNGVVAYGTAQFATATTIQLAATEVNADDTLIGCVVGAYGATQGYWQFRAITDYVLSTDTATVDGWTVTPSGTITYVVYAAAPGSTSSPIPANTVQIAGTAVIGNGTSGNKWRA